MMPGRCSAADLGTWPAASMRMWVTVSGTPDTPRCAYAATSGADTVMVFDADGVTYASLGLAHELGGSKGVVVGASAHVKPAFNGRRRDHAHGAHRRQVRRRRRRVHRDVPHAGRARLRQRAGGIDVGGGAAAGGEASAAGDGGDNVYFLF